MGHHSEEILASRDVPLLQGDALWPASLSILLQLKFGGFFLPWEHFPELPSFHTSLPGPFVCHRYHPTPVHLACSARWGFLTTSLNPDVLLGKQSDVLPE